jgi:hypothetical protein
MKLSKRLRHDNSKYMAKAKAEAALLDGQKQFAEKGVKVLGDEGAETTGKWIAKGRGETLSWRDMRADIP